MAIPRTLHQIWWQGAAAVPAKFDAARASWAANHPPSAGWRIETWDEARVQDVLREAAPAFGLSEGALSTWFASIPTLIQKCDVARCFILYVHGGVYADMDTLSLQPIDPLLDEAGSSASGHAFVYCATPNNAVMASSARNPLFPVAWWPDVSDALGPQQRMGLWNRLASRTSPGWRVLFTTGPFGWHRVLSSMTAAQAKEWGVFRPPHHAFYPALLNSGALNTLTTEERAAMAKQGSYCYHSQEGDWVARGANIETLWLQMCQPQGRRLVVATVAAVLLAVALLAALGVIAYQGRASAKPAAVARRAASNVADRGAGV